MLGETPPAPETEGADELANALRLLQQLIWAHPVATQRAFSALVREGRAYAQTEEGSALRASLERSVLPSRARQIWDTLSMGAFSDDSTEVLPSMFIDAIARAAQTAGLEDLLSRVFIERT